MKFERSHLDWLESEAIYILREVAGESANPVLFFSGGKDSICLLRLAEKAFRPGRFPFPLMHIDTGHNFDEVIAFRDARAAELGERLIVRSVEDSIARGSVRLRSAEDSRNAAQSVTLLEAIVEFGFDAAIGGARRDEERSRAKERVFSVRDPNGQWDPKRQRPELWNLLNAKLRPGESIRVFPLSNWTELDVWHYIHVESIPIVPLYYAKEREVIVRGNSLIVQEQPFVVTMPGEKPQMVKCRMRSLGCSPCTGAIRSEADTIPKIINELIATRQSERQLRIIDHDQDGSMEIKKREGYF